VQSLELYAALRDQGVPAEMIVHPYESHGIEDAEASRDYLIRNLDWFDFWLNKREDPASEKREQYARWRQMREHRDRPAAGLR
jgi:predicted acyl esterase